MKVKALFLTALLVVGSVASSMAQVYSANAVGYVNVDVPAGKTILANPLINGDNHADTVMPLSAAEIGMLLFRFDPVTQNFAPAITWAGDALGWVNAATFLKEPAELFILNPGEGFFVQSGGPVQITFVGDVPQGTLTTPVYGGGLRNMLASQVPQEAGLRVLEFPGEVGDLVFLWDDGTQNFTPAVTWAGDALGWVDATTFVPVNDGDGPVVPVGRGFFVQKSGPAEQSWDREFSVN